MRALRRGGRRPVLVVGEEEEVVVEVEVVAMGSGPGERCRSVACIALSLAVNCNSEGEVPSFGGVHTTLTPGCAGFGDGVYILLR